MQRLNEHAPNSAAGGAQTSLTFNLNLAAGGMAGPVVNAMLEPLMVQAADELTERLIDAITADGSLAPDHD
jgi:hypothetical protein